jgi:hypothetical protein
MAMVVEKEEEEAVGWWCGEKEKISFAGTSRLTEYTLSYSSESRPARSAARSLDNKENNKKTFFFFLCMYVYVYNNNKPSGRNGMSMLKNIKL